jgi:microcompartment protein CcmK/EutM
MKVGRIIGRVSLVRPHESVRGRKFVLAVPLSLDSLREPPADTELLAKAEELVAIDELGVTPGDLVGLSDGAEAANAYHPKPKPVDAYVTCLLDRLDLEGTP